MPLGAEPAEPWLGFPSLNPNLALEGCHWNALQRIVGQLLRAASHSVATSSLGGISAPSTPAGRPRLSREARERKAIAGVTGWRVHPAPPARPIPPRESGASGRPCRGMKKKN